ncbi:NAD-dependent epimerase/dehydratase family protein [candidate division CSSED10-310 bacterium]|uniref:NAD-dependent epimerase/dehydratase family protein n=1 Tax=candidate division CSSED10-310 bacterium TaxID=2855610 RepID=A0ABV6YV39_UNCC1
MRTIAITSSASFFGQHLIEDLSYLPHISHIVAFDVFQSHYTTDKVTFFRADIGHPLIFDIFSSHKVDTVIHLASLRNAFDQRQSINFRADVSGTIKILEACAMAGIRNVIITSSAAVYGAVPDNPLFLSEDTALNGNRSNQFVKHKIEIEKLCSDFAIKHPETNICILRLAPFLNTTLDFFLTRLWQLPTMLTVLGYDPLLQLLHEEDLLQVFRLVIEQEIKGIFNVASAGTIPLQKMLRLAQVTPLPLLSPFVYHFGSLLWSLRLYPAPPEMLDYLRYNCVVSIDKIHSRLGFQPLFTTDQIMKNLGQVLRLPDREIPGEQGLLPSGVTAREPWFDILNRHLKKTLSSKTPPPGSYHH